jgi:hypothetical protein
MVKYFCDRCGKEAPLLKSVPMPLTQGEVARYLDLCTERSEVVASVARSRDPLRDAAADLLSACQAVLIAPDPSTALPRIRAAVAKAGAVPAERAEPIAEPEQYGEAG